MKKVKFTDGASGKDKKAFGDFLSEDEELVLATGFGKNYIRHQFALFMMIPGGIAWVIGAGYAYYYGYNIGYGLLAGLAGSIIYAYLKTLWVYHANRFLLTTRRVIIKQGLIATKLKSALYDKITHIEVDQSLMDRLVMKHGSVLIHTAGGGNDEIKILNIDDPLEFKNLLERLINRERERFGGSTGPVVTLEGELVE